MTAKPKPLDLAALQAICSDIGTDLRREAVASGTLLQEWSDTRGFIDIDPSTGKEPNVVVTPFSRKRVVNVQAGGTAIVTSKEIKQIAAVLLASTTDPRERHLRKVRSRLAAALLAKLKPKATSVQGVPSGGKRISVR
jgi:hypothetical protein